MSGNNKTEFNIFIMRSYIEYNSWTVNIHRKYKLPCLLKCINNNKRKENNSHHAVHDVIV